METTNRLDQLLQLLKESPRDSFLLFALAKEYEKRGELEESLHYFRRIQANDPDYVGMYYHLGKACQQLRRADEARAAFEEGMKRARKLGEAHAHNELAAALAMLTEEE